MDVFISRKLNSRNRMFGFVRFQGVEDVYPLEKKLDAIWIGTWKLQVNLPKYNRSKRVVKKRGELPRHNGRVRVRVQQRFTQTGNGGRKGVQEQTFAEVVSRENVSRSSSEGIATQLKVEVDSSSWLINCYVERLLESPNMQLVKESFVLGGFGVVRLKYLGEKFVLLSCDEEGLIKKLIEENKDWFAGSFAW